MAFAQQRLNKVMRRARIDAVLFFSLENIRYLCGFTGSDGALVVNREGRIFLSDGRYEEQARKEIQGADFVRYRQKMEGLARFLESARVKRVGFEAASLSYENYGILAEKLPRVSFLPLGREIAGLRAQKDPAEMERIRKAIQIASASFTDTASRLKPGMRERTAADFLEYRMKRRGGDKPAFDTIVASGPRSALPHGAPTERRLEKNEMVVVDFGVRFQGYHSDETKTLILGSPDSRQRTIYETVRRAREKAMKTIRPGVSVRAIDAAAREVIHRAGYGKFFGHGTGHGVGLAIHEAPTLSPKGRGVVEEGMVFTVEPGIYIPQWGGVRLEDMIWVTGNGYEMLTFLAKDLPANIV